MALVKSIGLQIWYEILALQKAMAVQSVHVLREVNSIHDKIHLLGSVRGSLGP